MDTVKVDLKKNIDINSLIEEIHRIKKRPNIEKSTHGYGLVVKFDTHEVSFTDLISYDQINSILLKSAINFNGSISNFSKGQIIRHTISIVAEQNIQSSEEFLKILQEQCNLYYKGKNNQEFNLLATISISKLPFDEVIINGNKLTFGTSFPDLFNNHRANFINTKFSSSIKENVDFLKVVITVQDRDAYDAFEKAFKSLEVLRSLLCLQTTSYRTPIYKESINRILLGDIFTIHSANGEIFDEYIYWYETQNRSIKIYEPDNETLNLLERQTISLLSNIDNCKKKHKRELIDILSQYVSAFDIVNKTSCFLKGWTVLENLLNTHKNEILVKRCVAGYLKPELPKLKISALNKYRNELVHEICGNNGDGQDSETLTFCYMLHNFLLSQISFHLNKSGIADSVKHYSDFLDYLNEKEQVKNKEEMFKDFLS